MDTGRIAADKYHDIADTLPRLEEYTQKLKEGLRSVKQDLTQIYWSTPELQIREEMEQYVHNFRLAINSFELLLKTICQLHTFHRVVDIIRSDLAAYLFNTERVYRLEAEQIYDHELQCKLSEWLMPNTSLDKAALNMLKMAVVHPPTFTIRPCTSFIGITEGKLRDVTDSERKLVQPIIVCKFCQSMKQFAPINETMIYKLTIKVVSNCEKCGKFVHEKCALCKEVRELDEVIVLSSDDDDQWKAFSVFSWGCKL